MPDRPTARSRFVDALRGIAAKHELEVQTFSSDWIVQITDPKRQRKCSIFGYTFDLNPSAATEICKEKAATSLVMDGAGVPNIPHMVFLSPSNEFTAPYLPRSGNWVEIQKTVQELGFPVVLKPLKGTGGLDVIKATCWRDVEAAVQHLFRSEHGLAVSPYKKLLNEYRCVCLDGTVELIYNKVRSSVTGDGKSTVGALVATLMSASSSGKETAGLVNAAASLSPEDLARVPAEGEAVPLEWRHNLGQGATADLDVPEAMREQLKPLAVKAAAAIGIRFSSVDVAEVEGEGLMIMEVNGGVMMDSLMGQLGEAGAELASRLYETAVMRALERQ
mmetsp:Transcript_3396/g.7800  ORF Transcript_3396/g.7800 Transcript_3396/m.7800 type:complete len:333 (+) Transcript_3396:54-1052(+)